MPENLISKRVTKREIERYTQTPTPSCRNAACAFGGRRYGRTVIALYIFRPTGKMRDVEPFSEEFISLRS